MKMFTISLYKNIIFKTMFVSKLINLSIINNSVITVLQSILILRTLWKILYFERASGIVCKEM